MRSLSAQWKPGWCCVVRACFSTSSRHTPLRPHVVETSHVHELLAETTSIKSSCCVTRTCMPVRVANTWYHAGTWAIHTEDVVLGKHAFPSTMAQYRSIVRPAKKHPLARTPRVCTFKTRWWRVSKPGHRQTSRCSSQRCPHRSTQRAPREVIEEHP